MKILFLSLLITLLVTTVACGDIPFKSCIDPEVAKAAGVVVELDKLYSENTSSNKFPAGSIAKISFEGVLKAGQIAEGTMLRATIKMGGVNYYDWSYALCDIVTGGYRCPMRAPTKTGKTVRSKFTISEQMPYYLTTGEFTMTGTLSVEGREVACFESTIIVV